MAQPDCERYLTRERKHGPTPLKIKKGAWVPFPQQLNLLRCLIYLWFQSLFNKGTVGKNFCSIIDFQRRSHLRSECDFSCLVHIFSAKADFFGFYTDNVHEISALNSDGSAFLVCPWVVYFFNFHHSLFFPAYCFVVIPTPILCPLFLFS